MTPPVSTTTSEDQDIAPVSPSKTQLNSYKSYASFRIFQDGEPFTFGVDDFVYVVPHNYTGIGGDDTLWIARIKSIHAQDPVQVWCVVEWLYSPEEVALALHDFDSSPCGSKERILSTHEDIVPASSCDGHADMVSYDEHDVEQMPFDRDTNYYRPLLYVPSYKQLLCTTNGRIPRLSRKSVKKRSVYFSLDCTCRQPYCPDKDVMRFCPRQQCRKAYHDKCLRVNYPYPLKSGENLEAKFETSYAYDVDPNDIPTLYALIHKPGPSSSKKKRVESSRSQMLDQEKDPYADIPPLLLSLARSPIIRGSQHGVVGNVKAVVEAREILRMALSGKAAVPEDWADRLGAGSKEQLTDLEEGLDQLKSEPRAFACPTCAGPI